MLELYVVLHSIAYSILQIPQEKNCRTVFFFFFHGLAAPVAR